MAGQLHGAVNPTVTGLEGSIAGHPSSEPVAGAAFCQCRSSRVADFAARIGWEAFEDVLIDQNPQATNWHRKSMKLSASLRFKLRIKRVDV